MDTTPFKEAIKQFFRDTFHVEYLSNFDVDSQSDGDLYRFTAKFQLNQENKPITISGQFATLGDFTTFAIEELRTRRFPTVDYFYLVHAESLEEQAARANKHN